MARGERVTLIDHRADENESLGALSNDVLPVWLSTIPSDLDVVASDLRTVEQILDSLERESCSRGE